jgi:putative N6-adenine-specific DNA methylase
VAPRRPPDTLSLFAITAPGLEAITARELAALGARGIAATAGGLAWRGALSDLYTANLWLRTASRVVVRLARFRATAFHELERHARRVSWEAFVTPDHPVRLRVTCRKSKLYHSDAVAQRIEEAIAHRLGVKPPAATTRSGSHRDADDGDEADDAAGADAQLFIVRLAHDEVTISADSSGALLHQRGYRQALGKAPMRETLAAAMLLGSGWAGADGRPLLDPMCGSGTIPIEGALLSRRIAPGSRRAFAFQHWPGHEAGRWDALVAAARDGELARSPVRIVASDRDAGAIAAASSNAGRAGVAADIDFSVRPISDVAPPAGPGGGLLASNPPYGVRLARGGGAAAGRDRLRDLYAQLGNVARARFAGWTLTLMTESRLLERQVGVPFTELFQTSNGGIAVRVVTGQAGEGADR